MIWNWLNKAIIKIAAEVHKTKIDEFEQRILKMEQKHALMLKTIEDNQAKLDKLDERLYKANIDSASAVGAINALIHGHQGNNFLNQNNNSNE